MNDPTPEGFALLPRDSIRPWPGNPRKTFDEDQLKELAESLKVQTMLQPLLVRPRPAFDPTTSIRTARDLSPKSATALVDYGVVNLGDLLERAAAQERAGKMAGQKTDADRAYAAARTVPGVFAGDAKAVAALFGEGGGYELADGERRWRAAAIAGLDQVPAIVRPLTDRAMLEIAVVSFEQRADLSALEKAEGYARLIEEHGATVEEVADKIGKSASTIRNLLKLRALPALGREAMAAGALSASTAQLIARVPDPVARAELVCCVVAGEMHNEPPTEKEARQVLAGGERNDEIPDPLSYRDTKVLIERSYMVELKDAPFSRKALDLVGDAGSCDECPKRTGNNPEYADSRADVCTDTACFHRKVEAHNTKLLQAAKDGGRKVLPKKECEKLYEAWSPTSLGYGADYVDLSAKCHEVSGGKTWRALVGKQLADQVVVAVDREGGVHELAPKAASLKIVRKDHGSKSRTASQSNHEAKQKQEDAERRRKAKAGGVAARVANGKVATALEQAAALTHGWSADSLELLRAVAEGMAEIAWSDACRAVVNRRGLETANNQHQEEVRKLALGFTKPGQYLGLIGELVAARKTLDWKGLYYAPQGKEKSFLDAFGVNRAKLVKEAMQEGKNGKPSTNGPAVEKACGKCGRKVKGLTAEGKCVACMTPDAITRETALTDLVDGHDFAAWEALEEAGLLTVGHALDQGANWPHGVGATQKTYSLLRDKSKSAELGNAIGDALIDAGLLSVGAPGRAPIVPPAANGTNGHAKPGKRQKAKV